VVQPAVAIIPMTINTIGTSPGTKPMPQSSIPQNPKKGSGSDLGGAFYGSYGDRTSPKIPLKPTNCPGLCCGLSPLDTI